MISAGLESGAMGAQPTAARRNDPCPCGSGRRYKDCHGALSGAPSAVEAAPHGIRDAMRKFRAGDFAGAERIARAILNGEPHDVDALHVAALCALECRRTGDALQMFLAAARASLASGQDRRRLWADINLAYKRALSGLDSAFAAERRVEYERWRAALPAAARTVAPSVTVIVTVINATRGLDRALASIEAQTQQPSEVIVADGRTDAAREAADERLATFQPAPRLLALPGSSEAALIDAGVRAATSEFVNVLSGDDEFLPGRIARFVDEVAGRERGWGFGAVELVDADGAPVALAALGHEQQPLAEIIAESDTVGWSLVHRKYVAAAPGNLFFSRALYERAGGMRPLERAHAWDFCLRALWHEEPVYVPAPLYRRTVSVAAPLPDASQPEECWMFSDFYAHAVAECAPNPFAPCVHHWLRHFYKAPFYVGHAELFGLERLSAIAAEIGDDDRAAAGELTPGVDLVGFAFAEFGLAESLRGLAASCREGGIPFAVRDVDMRIRTRQIDQGVSPHVARDLSHRCAVFCINPDMMQPLLPLAQASSARGGRVIGYWYWELESLPRQWAYALDAVDELWAASEFIAEAMRGATAKPVIKIPPPVEPSLSRAYARSDFGLLEDRFLFLFSFDFNSFTRRKNPDGLVNAFKRAFGTRKDVGLVVKSVNGVLQPERMQALQAVIDGDERIVLKDEFLSRDEVSGLESVVDAFASLHRSEGFGLGLAESMALGKPVLGTAYSGNLEFMTEANSCLVNYEMVSVGEGDYLYDDSRFRWAEPDLDHAAYQMRRLVDDAGFRSRIAAQGRLDVSSRFTRTATAALMRRRLAELGLV